MTQSRRQNEPEPTWLGHHDFGSARWVAWALVLFCAAGLVGSAAMFALSRTPIAATGMCVLLIGMGILMLPPALYGRSRSAGIKLGCVCLLLCGGAFTLISVAGFVEPEFFEGGRAPFIRAISPVAAVACCGLSASLLRKILRHRQT